MPKKSKSKGGAFAYTQQFDTPLSPCYNPSGNKQIPKLGWHSGGSSCDTEPSVSAMGIIDTPLNKEPSSSELAWSKRYECPTGLSKMTGGNNLNKLSQEFRQNYLKSVKQLIEKNLPQEKNIFQEKVVNKIMKSNNKSPKIFKIKALKQGQPHEVTIIHTPEVIKKQFIVVIQPPSGQISHSNHEDIQKVQNKLKNMQITNVSESSSNSKANIPSSTPAPAPAPAPAFNPTPAPSSAVPVSVNVPTVPPFVKNNSVKQNRQNFQPVMVPPQVVSSNKRNKFF